MIDFLREVLSYEFMRNALLDGVIVSAACGVVGTLVVLNRIVFISGGIAHAAYGGVGIAYFLGLNPVWGAVGFSLLSSLAMGYVHRKEKARADTIIGVMWALGMALGIIFVSLSPGYKADLMSYLFGSILAVSTGDLWLMAVIALVVLAFVLVFYRLLLAISFDETFSTVRNVPVGLLSMAMIVLIGLTVVISMRVVGLILVIALLTIPPAIANLYVREMRGIMVLSTGLSLLFMIAGLLVSYALNLPSGAVIILLAGLAYALAAISKGIFDKRRQIRETTAQKNDLELIR
ncbi:MAG: metal ABC transporter permease [Chloroflexi bacterium]|jgi:zinc transport system permease protein|nr:metal ABC transporter permease [Anaerolineaceae bacterium]NLI45420.1 metal ABC transporter permease [Chloroflexota bacterium]HOE35830.1 metal ABC transporter permease [Anaerolineaceae bacterium]HQL28012.1 metal ABC transporter permease [Anaerolineaceae bacterium]